MDSDGLPLVGPGIDYNKVGAINQKRTVAFLNHFITHTASFLNRFSVVCEEKLSDLSIRLQRLEVTMTILEAKLNSVPGLENVTVQTTQAVQPSQPTETSQQPSQVNGEAATPASNSQVEAEPPTQTPQENPGPPVMTVAKDPRYAQYFKMLNMGIPEGAVKQKMSISGHDPSILDNPDAPSDGAVVAEEKPASDSDFSASEHSDSDSEPEFSD